MENSKKSQLLKTQFSQLNNSTQQNQISPPESVEKSPAPQGQGDLSTDSFRKFFTAYGAKRRIRISFPTEGRTKQSFKAECDINTIMARYMRTGLLDHVQQGAARYLDVTGADFYDAQNLVAGARSMFFGMPSHLREQFDNDPGQFLEFMENPANAQEAIKMGLRAAPEAPSYPPSEASASVQPAASTQAGEASPKPGNPAQTKPAEPVARPSNT